MSDWQHTLIGGGLAGIISDGISHPLSTIKARLQVGSQVNSSFLQHSQTILKQDYKVLFRGFTIISLTAPARALYFGAYETVKYYGNANSPITQAIAGPLAQFSGSLLWVPMDVIKERMQVQGTVKTSVQTKGTIYKHPLHCFQHVIKTEGFKGIYRGFLLHQLVWSPFNFIFFPLYEALKKANWLYDDHINTTIYPSAAFLSAIISGAVTSPLDNLKVRLQTQPQYKNALHCFKSIIKEQGIKALFRGTQARVVWIAPNMAMTLSLYTYFTASI